MLSRLQSLARKAKGKERETPPSPTLSPDPSTASESLDFVVHSWPPSPPLLSQEEQDAKFAASLVEQEERHRRLRLEEDEAAARELAERDQADLDLQQADADAMVWQMLEKEQLDEDQKKRDDETWFEREKLKHDEAERRRMGVLVCETCEGEFFDAKLMAQCSEGHLLCVECAGMGFKVRFESLDASLSCLVDLGTCEGTYTPQEATKFLDPLQLVRWGKLRLRSDLEGIEGLTTCPSCDYAVLLDDPTHLLEIFECQTPTCMGKWCLKCREVVHPGLTCIQANPPATIHALEESMSAALIRACPSCRKTFVKESGCNMITCKCGTMSCYICRATVSGYGHWDKAGPCKGKLYDDLAINVEIEQARQAGVAGLDTDDERRHGAALKIA